MDVLSIIVGASALFGGAGSFGAFAYWREVHSSGQRSRRREEIDHAISQAVHPVHQDLTSLHAKLEAIPAQRASEMKIAIAEALEPVKNHISMLSTKIEPLWHALEQLAIDNARLLHKPHPENAEFDALLDKFIASQDGGYYLTREEDAKLRHFLQAVRDWRGEDIGIVVEEGDPTRAAILLRTMGLSRIRSEQERKK